jgi:hypothetical protein
VIGSICQGEHVCILIKTARKLCLAESPDNPEVFLRIIAPIAHSMVLVSEKQVGLVHFSMLCILLGEER